MCDWNEDCILECDTRDEHDWWNREALTDEEYKQLPIWDDEEWAALMNEPKEMDCE